MADVKHTPEEVNAALLEAAEVTAGVFAPFAEKDGEVEIFSSVAIPKGAIANLIAAIALAKGEKVDG